MKFCPFNMFTVLAFWLFKLKTWQYWLFISSPLLPRPLLGGDYVANFSPGWNSSCNRNKIPAPPGRNSPCNHPLSCFFVNNRFCQWLLSRTLTFHRLQAYQSSSLSVIFFWNLSLIEDSKLRLNNTIIQPQLTFEYLINAKIYLAIVRQVIVTLGARGFFPLPELWRGISIPR